MMENDSSSEVVVAAGDTPLHTAIRNGDLQELSVLLRSPAKSRDMMLYVSLDF